MSERSYKFKVSRPGDEGVYKLELSDATNSLQIGVDFPKGRLDILYHGKNLSQNIAIEFGGAFSIESKEAYPLTLPKIPIQEKIPAGKGAKYIPRIKSLVTPDGIIRAEDMSKVFGPRERTGLKNFLNNLVKRGYAQKVGNDYKLVDSKLLEKLEKVEKKERYVKYLPALKMAIEDGIIKEEKIDEIFTTSGERKGVKHVLLHFKEKGLVELLSNPGEKFRYKIKPELEELYGKLYGI